MEKIKTIIIVTKIKWDAPKNAGLPTKVTINVTRKNQYLLDDIDGYAENLSNYLSDIYGYCHYGFTVKCKQEKIRMYQLIKNNECLSLGGTDKSMEVVKTGDKEHLKKELKKIVRKAIKNSSVEYINDIERDKFSSKDIAEIKNEVVINYFVDGMTMVERDVYTIIKV